jgi:hypothetical protein
VAIDTPAIEYNTDGTYKGLLVEPASTNLCLQSEDINTTWNPANATPTQSTEETPDGDTTNKYIKLVDDNTGGGATGSVYVEQVITVTGGAKYTGSVFLKKSGLNWARLMAFGAGSVGNANPSQYFDLDTGALGTGNAGIDDATIEEYPNGWYRCSITWTQGAGDTSFLFVINVADGNNVITVDLDGTSSIFVWGAQVEEGPIATSYIPTTTASVTRNKDDISLTGASDLIGQSEGTLYAEVDWRKAGTSQQILISINDGNFTNRINFISSSNTFSFAESGISITESNGSYTGIQKFALAYATNNSAGFRNGSQVGTTDTTCTISSGKTDIDIGQSFAASAQANMWIRAVALYKTRLTDDQLADLTS